MTMLIGINAVAAFKQPRTGVEEYAYQLIKHLAMLDESREHRFLLYCGKPVIARRASPRFLARLALPAKRASLGTGSAISWKLPDNFQLKRLKWSLPAWTQIRLASEMAFNGPDVLFIPVHILPMIHPKNSVVTIHGLEYEYYPQMYPKKHLAYLRWSAKYALKYARKIIAVSENTKKDLVELYGGKADKITVIHHGVGSRTVLARHGGQGQSWKKDKYILYLGRIETKKNVQGLIAAFNLLKKKYKVPHKLVLAGARGWDFDRVVAGAKGLVFRNAKNSQREFFAPADLLARPEILPQAKFQDTMPARKPKVLKTNPFALKDDINDIIFTGYVPEQQKWDLLRNADLFAFPSFYEGFGMPILEAQQVGCPVLSSNVSSIPEVVGNSAVLIDPNNIEQICEAMYKIISDKKLRDDTIKKGHENVKKFSWRKCAKETLKLLLE